MKFEQLETKLGYSFKDKKLLHRALTHRSFGCEHNERLEFLGDSILNFSVGFLLFKFLQEEDEGDLSRIRASLVNQETLADLATYIGLPGCLKLGEGELKSGGLTRPSIMADALEAVFAAIYLDSDMKTAQHVIQSLYTPLIQRLDVKTAGKDSKTQLQELLQAYHYALPKYEVIEVHGVAHNQEFEVECILEALSIVTQAIGQSRRQAEQKAAALALIELEKGLQKNPKSKHKKKKN